MFWIALAVPKPRSDVHIVQSCSPFIKDVYDMNPLKRQLQATSKEVSAEYK